jgi:hypothetical protein
MLRLGHERTIWRPRAVGEEWGKGITMARWNGRRRELLKEDERGYMYSTRAPDRSSRSCSALSVPVLRTVPVLVLRTCTCTYCTVHPDVTGRSGPPDGVYGLYWLYWMFGKRVIRDGLAWLAFPIDTSWPGRRKGSTPSGGVGMNGSRCRAEFHHRHHQGAVAESGTWKNREKHGKMEKGKNWWKKMEKDGTRGMPKAIMPAFSVHRLEMD